MVITLGVILFNKFQNFLVEIIVPCIASKPRISGGSFFISSNMSLG